MHKNKKLAPLIAAAALRAVFAAPIVAFSAEDDVEVAPETQAAADKVGSYLAPDNFYRMVFASAGGPDQARAKFEGSVQQRIEAAGRREKFTVAEIERLKMAGTIDMQHFFNQIEDTRLRLLAVNDRQVAHRALSEISRLQKTAAADLYHEQSFFTKSLRRIVAEKDAKARRELYYTASVEVNLIALGVEFGLTGEQDTALIRLVLDETAPPRQTGAYSAEQIMMQLATIPEQRLVPLLTQEQCEQLQRRLEPYRKVKVVFTP